MLSFTGSVTAYPVRMPGFKFRDPVSDEDGFDRLELTHAIRVAASSVRNLGRTPLVGGAEDLFAAGCALSTNSESYHSSSEKALLRELAEALRKEAAELPGPRANYLALHDALEGLIRTLDRAETWDDTLEPATVNVLVLVSGLEADLVLADASLRQALHEEQAELNDALGPDDDPTGMRFNLESMLQELKTPIIPLCMVPLCFPEQGKVPNPANIVQSITMLTQRLGRYPDELFRGTIQQLTQLRTDLPEDPAAVKSSPILTQIGTVLETLGKDLLQQRPASSFILANRLVSRALTELRAFSEWTPEPGRSLRCYVIPLRCKIAELAPRLDEIASVVRHGISPVIDETARRYGWHQHTDAREEQLLIAPWHANDDPPPAMVESGENGERSAVGDAHETAAV